MIRVTQAFQVSEETGFNEPGLLIFLDLKQKEGEFFIEPSSTVRIHRPDGTFIDRIVKGVSISGDDVAFFFPNMERHEIPKSSEIEIMPSP
jgi:hypothetical protein